MLMKYWLLKTEPEEWSWEQQIRSSNKSAEWSGVRNFQATKNLRNMTKGDKCFFYHTGKTKSIIGVVTVIKEAFLDKEIAISRIAPRDCSISATTCLTSGLS